jgi:hypothetical protein
MRMPVMVAKNFPDINKGALSGIFVIWPGAATRKRAGSFSALISE